MRRVKQLLRKLVRDEKPDVTPRKPDTAPQEPVSRSTRPVDPPKPFDPLAPDVVDNPYPFYDVLRETDPVHRCQSGAWLLTRYNDVLSALADSRLGNAPSPYAVVHERNRQRYVCADVASHIIPFLDPPRHTAPRKLIGKCFRDQLRRRPPDAPRQARSHLQGAKAKSTFDLIADYGTPFSVAVMGDLMGVPDQDHDKLTEWSEWFFYLFMQIPNEETRAKMDAALTEFRAYFQEWIERRKREPGEDFLSALASLEGDSLGRQDIIDTCMLLFADGVENVDKSIAGIYLAPSNHPAQMEILRAQPELIVRVTDELLRFDSPAQLVGRVALEDFSLRGKRIKRGASVLLGLGSANHDPNQFSAPGELNLQRKAGSQLAFGKARHTCIGAPLVKQEIIAGLAALVADPAIQIQTKSPTYRARPGHRWLKELIVSA